MPVPPEPHKPHPSGPPRALGPSAAKSSAIVATQSASRADKRADQRADGRAADRCRSTGRMENGKNVRPAAGNGAGARSTISSGADSRGRDKAAESGKSSVSVEEARLFDLVRMIREWVERSFSPEQEARMKEKGRLCSRFQVALGKEMTSQLQAYVAASFVLRLIKFRVVEKEQARGPPQECVEIILTPEARDLYALKCPDAVAKHSQQLAPVKGDGLVDVNGDGEGSTGMELEAGQEALESGQLALPGKAASTEQNALGDASGHKALQKMSEAPATARSSQSDAESGTRKRKQDAEEPAHSSEGTPVAKRERVTPAPVSGTGSVWERVVARVIEPGAQGVAEAKDALDAALAKRALGGLEQLRAESEAVALLKGLVEREVSVDELRETKIGLTVNSWRKHKEVFISSLALSLLSAWKKEWREADRKERLAAAKAAAN